MSSKKIIASLIAGTVIGILLAPRKGSETRKKIADSLDDFADCIQNIINSVRDEVNNEVNSIADQAIEKVENAESKINEALA